MSNSINPTQGNLTRVFFQFSIPTILGLLSMASATIVDGIFVGNFVGSNALAAINICIPFMVFIYGGAVMFATGASVICGKYLGEGKKRSASDLFSKANLAILILALAIFLFGMLFLTDLARLLGAQGSVLEPVKIYLFHILFFLPGILLGFALVYFARVNHQPKRASLALIAGAVLNFVLDYIFVVKLQLGIKGAALATGIAQSTILLVLLPGFVKSSSLMRYILPKGSWKDLWKAAYNGFSELLNETSTGIVLMIFNIVIIRTVGVDGVAAFTVVNYVLYFGVMVSYGVGESLHAPISINYGARKIFRIKGLINRALGFNFIVGLFLAVMLIIFPRTIAGFFIKAEEGNIINLAQHYIRLIWPAFLFSGITIALSGYFTAMQRPNQSAIIAFLRSLMLPIGFVFLFESILGGSNIFIAIPAAEFVSLIVAIWLYVYNTPRNIYLKRTPKFNFFILKRMLYSKCRS
ncbi:MAG: MATE family efflux transporter [Bacteroidales bacterium]